MLWNWYTVDACFLANSWHIKSRGMFAGSCIGVICLVLSLELLRRLGREYDSFIVRRARLRRLYLSGSSNVPCEAKKEMPTSRPNGDSKKRASVSAAVPANAMRDVQRIERQEAMLAPYRPSLVEHTVRSLMHMAQFAVAYIIMLLAMYFNGYIIICIFIGAFLGAFIFSWEPVNLNQESDATSVTKCCG
ncbi:Ctr copper transporter [Penicillium expansum]|nr:Ctr copper transporter [Penicillium expansum]